MIALEVLSFVYFATYAAVCRFVYPARGRENQPRWDFVPFIHTYLHFMLSRFGTYVQDLDFERNIATSGAGWRAIFCGLHVVHEGGTAVVAVE